MKRRQGNLTDAEKFEIYNVIVANRTMFEGKPFDTAHTTLQRLSEKEFGPQTARKLFKYAGVTVKQPPKKMNSFAYLIAAQDFAMQNAKTSQELGECLTEIAHAMMNLEPASSRSAELAQIKERIQVTLGALAIKANQMRQSPKPTATFVNEEE